jgi:prevent-host-death family protein
MTRGGNLRMSDKARRRSPEIIVKDGRPRAVILDIDEYKEMLERLEDIDDLKMLEEMRKKPLKFRKLEEFLEEFKPGV